MKKLLIVLSILIFSATASAAVTLYGGVSKLDEYDLGFGGGINIVGSGSGMHFGLDASYTMMSYSVIDVSIIEVMPIIKFGDKLFFMAGAGLELITVSAELFGTSISVSTTEIGIMGGLGMNLGTLVIDGRVKMINSATMFAGNIGIKF